MTGAQESEAQEQAVGQHGATQASPFHAAPLPPLRDSSMTGGKSV